MRFAVAHKAATYLMVVCAYLAMTTGGGVSPGLALGGLVAIAASWWWEPPRISFERWGWVWTTASVFALVYSVLTAVVTGDFLGVGAQFLTWLIVAKMFNRKIARDWQQIYLLAFLMLVAGSVLNPELTYGLCFLGFVISTTWAMTLFHLRREMEDNLLVKHAADRRSERVEVRRILDSRRIVGGSFFLGTGLLSFGVFLAAAALFLALPRVGAGFFLKGRNGLTLAGFSDGVKLGGHGVIKNDPTVVMRAKVPAAVGNLGAPQIHWRGVAFDRYSKGQWSRTARAPRTSKLSDQTGARERWYLPWDGQRLMPAGAQVEQLLPLLVRQDIYLDPLDSDVLFGAGLPRVIELEAAARARRPVNEQNDEVRLAHGATVSYTVYSQLEPPPAEDLRAASGGLPRGFDVYLQLPPEVTERTRAKAREITAGLTTTYDKAEAIKSWLAANLTYTLELREPRGQEPIDFFLFDRKQGHCEYFASAFAVLARAVDVPVRQVNGFLGGEWNEYQGYVAVRAGDAHAWDEVYFPGEGWVTYDPTPGGGANLLGRGGDGWTDRIGRFVDSLRFQWSKWVIEYDLASQLELFKNIGRTIKSAAITVRNGVTAAARGLGELWPLGLGLAVAGGALLLLRRRHHEPGRTEAGRRPRVRSPVAEVYHAALRQLTRAGVVRDPALTPRELATRMTAQAAPGAAPLAELVELYYAAEWGGQRDPAAEARAIQLARDIRDAVDASRRARRAA